MSYRPRWHRRRREVGTAAEVLSSRLRLVEQRLDDYDRVAAILGERAEDRKGPRDRLRLVQRT